jgi:hypothetical protein
MYESSGPSHYSVRPTSTYLPISMNLASGGLSPLPGGGPGDSMPCNGPVEKKVSVDTDSVMLNQYQH